MALRPLWIAVQGLTIGLTPIVVAIQGLWPAGDIEEEEPPPPVFGSTAGGGSRPAVQARKRHVIEQERISQINQEIIALTVALVTEDYLL